MLPNRNAGLSSAGFAELIKEHDHIESSISALLDDLNEDIASPRDLSAQLDALAVIVRKHIREECIIIQNAKPEMMSDAWQETWIEGESALLQLKADWTMFIDHWTESRIADDIKGFSGAANSILTRLSNRVQTETQCFYKVALLTGDIQH